MDINELVWTQLQEQNNKRQASERPADTIRKIVGGDYDYTEKGDTQIYTNKETGEQYARRKGEDAKQLKPVKQKEGTEEKPKPEAKDKKPKDEGKSKPKVGKKGQESPKKEKASELKQKDIAAAKKKAKSAFVTHSKIAEEHIQFLAEKSEHSADKLIKMASNGLTKIIEGNTHLDAQEAALLQRVLSFKTKKDGTTEWYIGQSKGSAKPLGDEVSKVLNERVKGKRNENRKLSDAILSRIGSHQKIRNFKMDIIKKAQKKKLKGKKYVDFVNEELTGLMGDENDFEYGSDGTIVGYNRGQIAEQELKKTLDEYAKNPEAIPEAQKEELAKLPFVDEDGNPTEETFDPSKPFKVMETGGDEQVEVECFQPCPDKKPLATQKSDIILEQDGKKVTISVKYAGGGDPTLITWSPENLRQYMEVTFKPLSDSDEAFLENWKTAYHSDARLEERDGTLVKIRNESKKAKSERIEKSRKAKAYLLDYFKNNPNGISFFSDAITKVVQTGYLKEGSASSVMEVTAGGGIITYSSPQEYAKEILQSGLATFTYNNKGQAARAKVLQHMEQIGFAIMEAEEEDNMAENISGLIFAVDRPFQENYGSVEQEGLQPFSIPDSFTEEPKEEPKEEELKKKAEKNIKTFDDGGDEPYKKRTAETAKKEKPKEKEPKEEAPDKETPEKEPEEKGPSKDEIKSKLEDKEVKLWNEKTQTAYYKEDDKWFEVKGEQEQPVTDGELVQTLEKSLQNAKK